MRKKIYVCSPLRATAHDPKLRRIQIKRNFDRVKKAARKIAKDGDFPIVPHLALSFLDDDVEEERDRAIDLGLELLMGCDELWVITDDVISDGMMDEIMAAVIVNIPVRMFDSNWKENTDIRYLVGAIRALNDSDDEDDKGEEAAPDEAAGTAEKADDEVSRKGAWHAFREKGRDSELIGDVNELIESVVKSIIDFTGDDNDRTALNIRIEKEV